MIAESSAVKTTERQFKLWQQGLAYFCLDECCRCLDLAYCVVMSLQAHQTNLMRYQKHAHCLTLSSKARLATEMMEGISIFLTALIFFARFGLAV
jgi:hypothetical protein